MCILLTLPRPILLLYSTSACISAAKLIQKNKLGLSKLTETNFNGTNHELAQDPMRLISIKKFHRPTALDLTQNSFGFLKLTFFFQFSFASQAVVGVTLFK